MIYSTQDELKNELKKKLKGFKTLAQISKDVGLNNPQDMTKIWDRKFFTFDDCAMLLRGINHSLFLDFLDDSKGEEYLKLNEHQKTILRTYEALSDIGKAEFRGMLKGMLR